MILLTKSRFSRHVGILKTPLKAGWFLQICVEEKNAIKYYMPLHVIYIYIHMTIYDYLELILGGMTHP
jgi:hypothetical protein